MDIYFDSVKLQKGLVYINIIIICFKTTEDRHKHINEVLRHLMKAGVTFKLMKFHSCSRRPNYLSLVIASRTLRVTREKTKGVDSLQ